MRLSHRLAAIVTGIAVVLSPVVATSATAGVAGYVGQTSGSPGTWSDVTLDLMTVGVERLGELQVRVV